MSMEQMVFSALLVGLLSAAVASDIFRHRIPNSLVLLGMALGVSSQVYSSGLAGLATSGLGLLVGLAVFLPLYIARGMAAGDVKLMAMVGSFLSAQGAIWSAAYSLMVGALCGFLIVLVHGQSLQTLSRYFLMLRARSYLPPAADEVAAKPFPYAVAIMLGTFAFVFWHPFGSLGG
ncbi:prepilin peptidase [Pseudomonas sp. 8AS]|uniref:A24 family peptidase n=1 Tax=Pseudomonas sp. 8AS TaxID=2653163 RepID=UPI001358768F|nr:prepilin peptidase [Pseudomonas sp. 8AS]